MEGSLATLSKCSFAHPRLSPAAPCSRAACIKKLTFSPSCFSSFGPYELARASLATNRVPSLLVKVSASASDDTADPSPLSAAPPAAAEPDTAAASNAMGKTLYLGFLFGLWYLFNIYFNIYNKQGTRVACTSWHRPSLDASDMEARSEMDIDESVSASTSHRKEPWLMRLMLGFSKSEKPWKVPWTSFTIIQVMFLWFCTFWLVGSWIIPFAAHYVGCSRDTLTYRGQALYSLITDIAEGTVGLGILHRCLSRFRPLPRNWFPFSWRGQWYVDVLLGCLTFPVVNRLSQLNLELLPFPSPLTSSYEQSIMSRDPIASVLYAIVVSVCCPIWEEVIFRGFLLPSLTRYLPMWASIFVSAVVFGLAHFNVQRMLPLTFLGLVMGIMFVRSQNLLSSMLLHSLWNGFVFMGLLR